ncbi:HutD family protein [Rhodanobacter glycinis]|uniref:HutD family protein n=1 Tax=Rhodanobacter glycinis TaxID=582702 RepID=A0A5B9E170_9GAMM|nr:HutD family protein [Rhodanobacter glycinis]QEE26033.1 HutD family protein [Rhodanobacter glycinis]
MPIIRLDDCLAKPWKNGLGRTREIAAHPSNAGMDDFLWRISVAEVDSAAPFSIFPGIDRVITLLDGDGFSMTLNGERTHALTTPCAPFAFAGEAQVAVALAGGPTRDFNLMVRRSQARGDVRACRDAGPLTVDDAVVLVYCARGMIDSAEGPLRAGDAWRPSPHAPLLVMQPDAVALVARVEVAT